MRDSKLNTLFVPAAGEGTVAPATLARATKVPYRVVVRNVGTTLARLSHDAATLQTIDPSANTYELPAGDSDVFVLAPAQALYAIALPGLGSTRVSVAISEAVPETQTFGS